MNKFLDEFFVRSGAGAGTLDKTMRLLTGPTERYEVMGIWTAHATGQWEWFVVFRRPAAVAEEMARQREAAQAERSKQIEAQEDARKQEFVLFETLGNDLRLLNMLRRNGLSTRAQVAQATDEYLLEIRGMGYFRLRQLRELIPYQADDDGAAV